MTRADLDVAMRWYFMGVTGWLVRFEAEHRRDAATLQGHWARLHQGLVSLRAP